VESLHEHILEELRDDVIAFARQHYRHGQNYTPTDDHILKILFKNYRKSGNGHKGLRLTYQGHRLLGKHYESYVYFLEDGPAPIKNKVLIALDRKMQWPYYIGKSNIVFFSKTDAGWYKLNGYSLEALLENM